MKRSDLRVWLGIPLLVLAAALVWLALVLYQDSPEPTPSALAEPAAFSAQGLGGATYSLASLQGQYVVLEWTSPECKCVGQHYRGYMQSLHHDFMGRGVKWFLVNSASPRRSGHLTTDQARQWLDERNVLVTDYLRDPEGVLARQYGARSTPTVVILDPRGQIIYRGGVDDNPEGNPARFQTSVNYVRDALEDALAGRPVKVPAARAYGCAVKYHDPGVAEAVGTTR